jgi:hypothetical protein
MKIGGVNMKRHILFIIPFLLMLFIYTNTITQTYTAEITITDLWFNSDESFKVYFRVDIYREGVLIPPDSNYYYEWYTDFSHDQQGWYLLVAGMGKYEIAPDQFLGDSIWAYVIINDSVNHTFENIQSDTIGPIEMTGLQPVTVDFGPFSDSGILIDDYVKPGHWRYTINQWRNGYRAFLTLGKNERIQACPNFSSPLEEKFRHWNNNNTDIIHYKSFYIDNDSMVIIANYKTVKENVVIKTVLMEGVESEYDSIQFKDPWVVDTTDSRFYTTPFGYHSLGMQTPFLSESSPLQLTFTSKYQGVFLRENEIFDPDLPIYSVRAQQNPIIPFHGQDITWYFQGWQGDPDSVIFLNPDLDSTAVVFKKPNATAKALYKGHLVSSSTLATAFNNGRQIAFEYDLPTSKWHLVYEDNGQIYYTYSSDGGETWQAEKRLSYTETGTNSQPSIFLFQPDVGPEAIQQGETSPILLGVVWNRELGYLNN